MKQRQQVNQDPPAPSLPFPLPRHRLTSGLHGGGGPHVHLKCGTGQCPPVSCAQGIALHIVPRRCHGEGQALGVLIRNAAVAGWGDLSHAQRCDGRGDVAREPTRGNRPAPGPGAPCSRLRPRARCAGRSHGPSRSARPHREPSPTSSHSGTHAPKTLLRKRNTVISEARLDTRKQRSVSSWNWPRFIRMNRR